jgi:protein-tyrosine phosphatase
MQFFKIEVAEQRRLMGIMEYHSKETTVIGSSNSDTRAPSVSSFPYSITAGVEKGTKNRSVIYSRSII